MAAAAPFIFISIFPVVDAMPLERKGNSTGSFDGPTQLGPWRVPFWAYVLIIGLLVTVGLSLLVCLIRFLISISCWSLCWSVDVPLSAEAEQRHVQKPDQMEQRNQQKAVCYDVPTDTQVYDQSHIRTYSVHSNNGAYINNNGNIAPYHQYTLPNDLQQQQKRSVPEASPWMFIPASMLSAKPPPSPPSRPSSEVAPIKAHPHRPPRPEHHHHSSHFSAP